MKSSVASALAFASVLVLGSQSAAWSQSLPEGASTARLATPLPQARKALIDGRFWTCMGDACAASHQDGADSQPLWMECAHVAAQFGALVEYRTGSDMLDPAKLARCNASAKRN